VIRELGLNLDIVNVNGGAVAMGHPLGCTGAKLTTTLLYEMKRRNVRYGLVTMCIGEEWERPVSLKTSMQNENCKLQN